MHVTTTSWADVIRRVQSHPQEVLYVDDNGNTPLHRACQLDPPVEVVTVLKDAVELSNSWGATPLHIAASHRCNGRALRELIDLYPGALSQVSRMGRTPIHYACMSYRGLDLVAFQILLEKTLEEGRRKQHEHTLQQQNQLLQNHQTGDDEFSNMNDISGMNNNDEFKITDFIDILHEAKDGDNMIHDDEDISVLFDQDMDSQFMTTTAGGASSVASFALATTRSQDVSTQNGDQQNDDDDDEDDDPEKNNNFNVVTWKDATGNTPLGLLFRRYRERVRSVITVLEQMRNATTTTPVTSSSSSLQTDLGHLWGKARLIVARLTEEQQQQEQTLADSAAAKQQREDDASSVGQHWTAAASWSKERLTNGNNNTVVSPTHVRASEMASAVVRENNNSTSTNDQKDDTVSNFIQKENRQFRIVHASVGLTGYGCPPEMIRLAISIHPHQVKEMDEDGNLVRKLSFFVVSQG